MLALNNQTTQELPSYFFAELERAVIARAGKKEGNEIRFLCPCHDDHNPSATYNPSEYLWHCFSCGASGGYINLAKLLDIELPRKNTRKFWNEKNSQAFEESRAKRDKQITIIQINARARKELELKAQKERFINADNDYQTAKQGLESPYCKHKGIPTFKGVHYHANNTLLPIINTASKVIAYQKIYREHGLELKFAKITCGPSKGGLFFIDQQELKTELPEDISGILLFCEGFSTGASLHLATGYPVICTISANAMEKIVEAITKKYHSKSSFTGIICTDNDKSKSTNIGLKVGRTVAYKFQMKICSPVTEEHSMDFNDVHTTHGLSTVRKAVMNSKRVFLNPNRLAPSDKGYKTYQQKRYVRLRGWS